MTQHPNPTFPALTYLGIDGVLVRFANEVSEQANTAALAFHRHILSLDRIGILESAPSLTAVYLRLDIETDLAQTIQAIEQEIAAQDWLSIDLAPTRLWTIPCSFDGPQLGEAAALAGVSERKAVEDITQTTTGVLTLGFAPGQPYLGNLDPHWNIPRMSGIAPNVPAHSLVVAVRQLIIFANDAPTGWRHIGQTAFRCFDKDRADPFAFEAGDQVRFERVDRSQIDALRDETYGGARLEVLP